MPPKRTFHLDADQLALIEAALTSPMRPEVTRRAHALRLLHHGQSLLDTAAALNVSKGTIMRWHRRWCAGGLEALVSRRGRPPVTLEYRQRLLEALEASDHWTVRTLNVHMHKSVDVLLGETRLRALLHQLGYTYQDTARELPIFITDKPQTREELGAWLTEMADRLPELLERKARWKRALR